MGIINRWMRDSLARQRPDYAPREREEEEDLEDRDATWMRQLANRAQSRFEEAISSEAYDINER